MVVPILTYGCEVWAPYVLKHNIDFLLRNINSKMENFHTRVCKNILGVKRNTSNIACRAELGRYPIGIHIVCNTYRYYLRIQGMDDSSLLGQAVMAQKTLLFSNNKNLFSFMNHISTNMDFQIPRKQQCIGLNKYKISKYSQTLKLQLTKRYAHIQSEMIGKSGKLDILHIVKKNVNFEKYLTYVKIVEHRKAISKLRTSSHDLPVEKQRLLKIPCYKRLCNLCTSSVVGDEFHVLFECTSIILQKLRDEALLQILDISPQLALLPLMSKFIYIMSCCDEIITRIVAPCLHKILLHTSQVRKVG